MSEQINFDHGKMALKKFNCMICVAESEGRECELDRQVANYCASLQSQLALHDQALDLKNKQLTTALNDLAAANERADGLQRIVDEARAQKPVALVAQHGGYAWSRQLHWEPGVDKQAIPAGTKLYADAPVPAQPAVVPKHAADRFHDMREVLFDIATSDVICDRPEHAFVTVAIDRDTLSRAAILSATEERKDET